MKVIFARKVIFDLQEQERLTREIAEAVVEAANPIGVTVTVEAVHTCMIVRGVQQANTKTVTR
jgi:GTP cyclohydrolase I